MFFKSIIQQVYWHELCNEHYENDCCLHEQGFTMSSFINHTDDIRQTIISAIATQRVIQLNLGSGWRTLEPYQLVYCPEDEKDVLLYGYCRDIIATSLMPSRWQYFHVLDVKKVELTNYCFEPLIEYYDQASTDEQVTLVAIESKSKIAWD